MTRRMIDSSIWQKESFVELPPAGRLLQIAMINTADDQGRLKANPMFLKGQIFPGDDISQAEIQAWLEQMHKNGTIILYAVDGRQYAQFVNWWKYQSLQYAQPSQHPKPEGWTDRIRRTATKGHIVTFNWHTVDNTVVPDTCDCEGNPLPKVAKPHTNGNMPPSQPVPPEPAAQQSGVVSPAHSPESTPERTILTKEEEENKTTLPCAQETIRTDGGGGGFSESSQVLNRQTDQAYAQVCRTIEDNGFGFMTPLLAEEVGELLKEYPLQWILDAMRIAVDANKRTMRYTAGVLRKWRADGRDPTMPGASPPTQPPKSSQPEVYVMPAAARALVERLKSLSPQ